MTSTHYKQEAKKRLAQSDGRVTSARVDVLSLLLKASSALTHQNLELAVQEEGLSIDRVTLYRVLDWLVEQGLAHKVTSADRTWHYNALLDTSLEQHAHFHCNSCDQVFCLESLQLAFLPNLPSGYKVEELNLNLQGRCPSCS